MHFNWLHLTDLHCGMPEQQWLWDTVLDRLLKDLKYLQPHSGPWDLILFTGDLTDRGTRAQFDMLDARLTRLIDGIAALQDGRQPILLAVPGNHDLQRPPADDEGLNVLAAAQPRLQKVFWDKPDAVARKTVATAFAEYCAWWDRRVAPQLGVNGLVELTRGALPGDFSATLARDGCRLGILGLNTAALQLTDDDYEHRLALHSLQFSAACGGSGLDWAARHHACLLMSHHPPAWLDALSRGDLEGQITDDGRFAVHLCGHLHEPYSLRSAVSGNPEKFLFQGRSLFGLENYGERQQRLHGYTAGRIDLGGPAAGTLVLWPRRGELPGGELRLNLDTEMGLPVGRQDTGPLPFKLRRPCTGAASAVLMPDAEMTWTMPLPAPAERDAGLAAAIDRELGGAALLRRALAERLRVGLDQPLGAALCAQDPVQAVTDLSGAALAGLRDAVAGEEGQTAHRAARRVFGLLLARLVRASRPAGPLAVEVRVRSHVGAEVVWACWQGAPTPAQFQVVEISANQPDGSGRRDWTQRILGEGDVLSGMGLAENGWESWQRYVLDAKRALWKKAVPPYRPMPAQFGADEDKTLREHLRVRRVLLQRSPHYLSVDRGDVREPLNDPQVLEALRRDVHLPILLIDESAQDLFHLPEDELLVLIEQCVHAIEPPPR